MESEIYYYNVASYGKNLVLFLVALVDFTGGGKGVKLEALTFILRYGLLVAVWWALI